MGKIFQPELAARGVLAATHWRRELWVGGPAWKAILGTRWMPGLLDRWLGAHAVEGQQDEEPLPPGRRDNLWEPVPGDAGAHGRFEAAATDTSLQYAVTRHRGVLGALALLGAAVMTRALLDGWRGCRLPHGGAVRSSQR